MPSPGPGPDPGPTNPNEGLAINFSGIGNITGRGSVYIYSGNNFNQQIKITGGEDFDGFGYSVFLAETGDNNIDLLVGAPYHERFAGRAYLYNYTGGINDFNSPKSIILSPENAGYFGTSASISKKSKRFLIGAPNFYSTSTGYVSLYDYSNLEDIT